MRQLLVVLLCASQCWGALTFANASTNRVGCGSGASIDDVNVGTLAVWYRPTSTSNVLRHLVTKDGVNTGLTALLQRGTNGTVLRFERDRATTDLGINSAASTLVANEWTFVAVTYDATSSTVPIMYKGNLTTAAASVGDGAETAGSGAVVTNAARDMFIGNSSSAATASLQGDVAWVGWWNYRLTLGEIHNLQWRPRRSAGNVFFKHFSTTATESDLSGNAHSCVVTGATATVGHVPIGAWFSLLDWRKLLRIPTYEDPTTRDLIFAD